MTVFISHITEEAKTADVLKNWLESTFLGSINVFVSSAPDDIGLGDKWLEKIDGALSDAKCLIVICSMKSINRPWINFETGAAWIKKIPIIPICHTGITKENLPIPLAYFQATEVYDDEFSKRLIQSLIEHLGFSKLPNISFDEFNNEILESVGEKIEIISSDDELGLLDHIVIVDEGFQELAEIANTITDATQDVNNETNETQKEFEIAKFDNSAGANKRRQRIAKNFSKPINEYKDKLQIANKEYEESLEKIKLSLYKILEGDYEISEEEMEEFYLLDNRLNSMHQTILNTTSTFNSMKKVLDDFPKLQRQLNKATRNASEEIGNFISNMYATLDFISRSQTLIQSIMVRN
ncbi:MAG TPA: toll/interleukin-1 receptor domain-containing protein [Gracilimonas sp.]|uniref:toll/interleukin-1 receptor domain-containing protein n=1 Tax=Gracilimonas sp. TaxID=1974203 RepID=UPI002DB32D41|nr:toll/interleukin-1 receptor domain-containing protein [Gracilimonas sp.]